MPTVVVLDASLSMTRLLFAPDGGSGESESENAPQSRHQLAVHGISAFLDHLSANFKQEFVALALVSSVFESVVPFTRDLESIKTYLNKVESYGKTCIEEAFAGVRNLVLDEWGAGTLCQVVLVTDGRLGVGSGRSLKNYVHSVRHHRSGGGVGVGDDPTAVSYLPFPFPCRFHVICVENPSEPSLEKSKIMYERLIELNRANGCGSGGGSVFTPEGPLSSKTVQKMFVKLCENHYVPFRGMLRCGNLSSHVQLSPPPEPYSRIRDFDVFKSSISSDITIIGFLDVNDVASPAAHSRHLVLPVPMSSIKNGIIGSGENSIADLKSEVDTDADESGGVSASAVVDDGRTPSFCVLLHGSLKVALMVAVCNLGEDWYGMLYSWADSKKKSNLMLSVFEPGLDAVPWFGRFDMLSLAETKQAGVAAAASATSSKMKSDDGLHFPVKPAEKRSYTQSSVIWIRQSGLQSDIQKIVRNARKLPEKTQIFYKELNRLKRGAVAFGFSELLDGMASILERECTLLPGTAHPDAALQLSHAANFLKSPHARDYNSYVQPLRTKFSSDDQ